MRTLTSTPLNRLLETAREVVREASNENLFELAQAVAVLDEGGEGIWATTAEMEAAELRHEDDECEVDANALVSHGEDGFWVSAWVWVPKDENDDE